MTEYCSEIMFFSGNWDNCENCQQETPIELMNIAKGLCNRCDNRKIENIDKTFDECVKKYGWKINAKNNFRKRKHNKFNINNDLRAWNVLK